MEVLRNKSQATGKSLSFSDEINAQAMVLRQESGEFHLKF